LANDSSPFPPRPEKRSPFPDPSLPQAGESLQEAAKNLWLDKFFFHILGAMVFGVVALTQWMTWWLKRPLYPWAWTVLAVAFAAIAGWRWLQIGPQLKTLHQGIRGEREVGRMLDDLRALGYEVFYDIPGKDFNVDHALIGPGGVFAIETKTLSKRKGATVEYDGRRVRVDGHEPDRDPVAQAEAVADFLAELLKGMTGEAVPVRPVVLYPGWWVSPLPRDCRVWVLNPKAMQGFLAKQPPRLKPRDVALFANRLTLHLRKD
jgi:hypothetical protein